MTARRVAIVILTWNSREEIGPCLESVRDDVAATDRVIVVDNGSADGTADFVASRYPWVQLLRNATNLGYAAGNNVGLRLALEQEHRFVLLLNSDTVVAPGVIEALVAHLEAEDAVGAVQPLLVDLRGEGIDSMGHALGRLPGVRDLERGLHVKVAPTRPVEVFGACGAAVMLRASTLRASGLFDESLFVLAEDVDLMFRIRGIGARVHVLPRQHVTHARGVSAGRRGRRSARKLWLQRNIVALALRYWPWQWLLVAAPLLAWRVSHALLLTRLVRGHRCWPLWWQSCRARRQARRALVLHDVDRWFGTGWLPLFRPSTLRSPPPPAPRRQRRSDAFDRIEVDVGELAEPPGT